MRRFKARRRAPFSRVIQERTKLCRPMLYVRGMGTKSEQLYDRSDAAFEILHDLGGVWRFVAWLRFVPRPIRNMVYNFIARHRYRWFGKYDACRLPKAGTNERFLP